MRLCAFVVLVVVVMILDALVTSGVMVLPEYGFSMLSLTLSVWMATCCPEASSFNMGVRIHHACRRHRVFCSFGMH